MRRKNNASKGPSQRQLRVGEEVRHVLSAFFVRNDFPIGELSVPVTVSQVDISPDLQNALVFVMPLGGQKVEENLAFLTSMTPYIREYLAKNVHLRRVPALKFALDTTFDKASHMEQIFHKLSRVSSSDDDFPAQEDTEERKYAGAS